jgi:hypothetical protein
MIIAAVATGNDSALAAARALGRSDAQGFEADLRAIEAAEREQLLAGRGSAPAGSFGDLAGDRVTLARLHREEAELTAFHTAVVQSRPWRIAEALRGLVGRAWTAPSRAGVSADSKGTATEVVGLEQRVRELADFRSAVQESMTWRLLQRLRRLAGREW